MFCNSSVFTFIMTTALQKMYRAAMPLCVLLSVCVATRAQYVVDAKKIQHPIPNTLWGLFFEDINRGADGGLYAELVKNRSFDFPKPMTGWTEWPKKTRDGIFLITDFLNENPKNPKILHVTTRTTDTVGLINSGYDGMAIQKGLAYELTLRFRQVKPGVHVRAFLFGAKNKRLGNTAINLTTTKGWQEQTVSITATDTAAKATLLVIFEGAGELDVDRISLFPADTWNQEKGGLRKDLVQAIADLKPGFLRFPGGCIVEGNQLVHRYQWKNTIGPLSDRLLVQSIWADDVPDRQTPDYMETFGLGFMEYFKLCEDIKTEPLPIINAGMSCQFDAAEVVPLSQLQPFIQDALDLIEFANGSTKTKWGKRRAELGHEAPFNMQYLGVGNENWGPQYADRLELFTRAIKQKYPNIKIVGATGYSRNEPVFKYMDSVLRARQADIIDEHFYSTPDWFYANSRRYDNYDRKGPKIFVGEYAAQTDRIGSMKNVNNLKAALSEAAWMTGLERNSDVVSMASYAPLFAHVEGWQWTPNLIWFDNAHSYKTPSYYVQQLFSLNRGTDVIPFTIDGKNVQGQDSVWASAVIDRNTNEVIIKLVNAGGKALNKTIQTGTAITTATTTTLSGNLADMNSLSMPEHIAPTTTTKSLPANANSYSAELPAYSLTILKLKP